MTWKVESDVDFTFVYDYLTFLHKLGVEMFGVQFAYGYIDHVFLSFAMSI